jgi:hypothetical protein
MIISHHGQLEFGSPKTPVFPEAMLLHYLDDLDSKMECMRHLIETDRQFAGNFTTYQPEPGARAAEERPVSGRAGPRAFQRARRCAGQARARDSAKRAGACTGIRIRAGARTGAQEQFPVRRQVVAGLAARGGEAGGLMRKAATRAIPPPLELLCLSALWSRGKAA